MVKGKEQSKDERCIDRNCNCHNKCFVNVGPYDRFKIYGEFWNLGDYKSELPMTSCKACKKYVYKERLSVKKSR